MEELRLKSFEDLHKLWWICLKERNSLAGERHEVGAFHDWLSSIQHHVLARSLARECFGNRTDGCTTICDDSRLGQRAWC